ncbi:c-type cytochrome [Phormidium sp. CLA17]|uniref:cytochrome c6 PetJ n=1 Tax=Leptolyngbya sp. Cla-17 TaxID=2803751 RepID=UPI0014930227|nr:c-type cytochrome [Leptolyngbya sp. Cla-17]MBM0742449.1 c-type cytochrome [Leptolyngbya sp. Cla-17]
MKALLLSVYMSIWFAIGTIPHASAANLANGAKLFNANCSACHMGGNNVIISSKTLKKEALEKYGMASLDAITTQVTNGKNAMPSFRSRLNDVQIDDIANYVINQSQQGW